MSKRPNTSMPTGKHNVFTHVPKDPNCAVCKLTKARRAPCRNRPEEKEETAITIHRSLEMLQRRITKFSVKRTNLVCSIVTQPWCRVACWMGSPRQVLNRRRRTRKDTQPAKRANTLFHGVAPQEWATYRPAVVPSCRRGQNFQ